MNCIDVHSLKLDWLLVTYNSNKIRMLYSLVTIGIINYKKNCNLKIIEVSGAVLEAKKTVKETYYRCE